MKAEAKLLACAILGAGALIGAGLYFGLAAGRSGVPVAAGSSVDLSKVTVAPPPARPSSAAADAATRPEALPIPTVVPSVDPVVQRLLAAQHETLRERCWAPATAASSVTVRVRFLFSAGKQRTLSVEESPEHPTLADCLRKHLTPLEIPDAGPAVASVVALTFP